MSVIYLAGGCFWGVQKYFDQFEGIIKTTVGYANGHTENPKYEDVKAEKTGHVETVKIEYDESLRSLNQILDDYYKIIDPTSLNKQGEDEGISYRTGIYYTNPYFPITSTAVGSTDSPKIYVNMVYTGGTSGKYDYNPVSHNFVELCNLGNTDLNLKGLYLHYTERGTNY